MNNKLREIGQEINTQNNRATSDPIFMVQQEVVQYGLDPDYAEDMVWFDTNEFCEADEEESLKLYENYDIDLEQPDGWDLTGKLTSWEVVQPFFTEKAAQRYIDSNKHNLNNPRIYVISAYRNDEFQAIRNYLKDLT